MNKSVPVMKLRVAAKYGTWYYTREVPRNHPENVLYTLISEQGIPVAEFGTLYHMEWYVRNGSQPEQE